MMRKLLGSKGDCGISVFVIASMHDAARNKGLICAKNLLKVLTVD